jgi:DNA polymerase I
MLIEADAKALEWLGAVYLSKDKTGYDEIRQGIDQHSDNQARFRLPSRLVAKTFVFRLIYGGTAYAYANDPEFTHVSKSDKYWQDIIDQFYGKYQGLHRWHSGLMREVIRTGQLVMPTGRVYKYERNERNEWPRTTILNYPVQGLGADLMAIARCSLFKRIKKLDILCDFISTVHDSIILDTPEDNVPRVLQVINDVWRDLPKNFEVLFKVPFDLPCRVECKVGPDWGSTKEIK